MLGNLEVSNGLKVSDCLECNLLISKRGFAKDNKGSIRKKVAVNNKLST